MTDSVLSALADYNTTYNLSLAIVGGVLALAWGFVLVGRIVRGGFD